MRVFRHIVWSLPLESCNVALCRSAAASCHLLDAQAFQTLVAAAPCDGRLVVEVKLILPTVSWGMSASVTGRDASMLPWAHVGQSE